MGYLGDSVASWEWDNVLFLANRAFDTSTGAIGALVGTFNADVASTMPTPPPGLNSNAPASLQQAKVRS